MPILIILFVKVLMLAWFQFHYHLLKPGEKPGDIWFCTEHILSSLEEWHRPSYNRSYRPSLLCQQLQQHSWQSSTGLPYWGPSRRWPLPHRHICPGDRHNHRRTGWCRLASLAWQSCLPSGRSVPCLRQHTGLQSTNTESWWQHRTSQGNIRTFLD